MTAGIYMHTDVDASSVFALFGRMTAALSDAAIATFMRGPVLNAMRDDAALRFATEGASDGRRWEPLSELGLQMRQSVGRPYPQYPINHRFGLLEEYVMKTSPKYVPVSGGDAVMTWPGEMPSRQQNQDGESTYMALVNAQQGTKGGGGGASGDSGATPARPVIAPLSANAIFDIQNALVLTMKAAI